MKLYLVGSLRNPRVPELANKIRALGYEVFDDWFAAGPEADDKWREYEERRGHTYAEALAGHAATHVFEFDRRHLEQSAVVVLVLPAGRSGHLELGYALGQGSKGYILMDDEPDRWDVMYKFADGVFPTEGALLDQLQAIFALRKHNAF